MKKLIKILTISLLTFFSSVLLVWAWNWLIAENWDIFSMSKWNELVNSVLNEKSKNTHQVWKIASIDNTTNNQTQFSTNYPALNISTEGSAIAFDNAGTLNSLWVFWWANNLSINPWEWAIVELKNDWWNNLEYTLMTTYFIWLQVFVNSDDTLRKRWLSSWEQITLWWAESVSTNRDDNDINWTRYYGTSYADNTWKIDKETWSGTWTIRTTATNQNNPWQSNYSDAWLNRASLIY